MTLRPLDPESSVSTNSTTWAAGTGFVVVRRSSVKPASAGLRDGRTGCVSTDNRPAPHFGGGHFPSASSARRTCGFSSIQADRDSKVISATTSSPETSDWQASRE